MLTLFHSPDSRSSRFIWLLEELGVEYNIAYCDIARRSGGSPDEKNPHPEKRVPALLHDGQIITEQAAIALYLTETFAEAGMGVPHGAPNRAAFLSWLAFYAGEIDPLYTARSLYGDRLHPMTIRDQRRVEERVATAVTKAPYLLSDRFSVADILVSGPFEWDPELAAMPVIKEWLDRLAARPAAQLALARDRPPSSLATGGGTLE